MILPILLAFASRQNATAPTLFELQDSNVKEASFGAVVPLPALNPRELNQLELAIQLLPQGSVEYTAGTIRKIVLGGKITCSITNDAASIGFSVPLGSEAAGENIMLSLLKTPNFPQEQIESAVKALQSEDQPYWKREVDPRPFNLTGATRDELFEVFHKVFALNKLEVGVLTPTSLPKISKIWDRGLTNWPPASRDRITEDPPPLVYPTTQPIVSTAELIGAKIPGSSADLPAQLLSLYALGSGKTSSLFRISRERHAWSYDQDSLLEPVGDGWEPRLFIAMAPNPENQKRLGQLKQELVADVQSWTEDNRSSALGMAEANLKRHVPYGPLLFADEPLGDDPVQRIVFDLYWFQKTGRHWSSGNVLTDLAAVDLATLKKSAEAIVTGSKIHYLSAEK